MHNCGLGPKLSDNSMVLHDVASGVSTVSAVCFIGILLIMAGIEPNPGPTGTHDRSNPLFENWNRVAYGYRYLKTGLTGFISSQVGRRHTILKLEVDQQCHDVKPCSGCTSHTLLPDHGTVGCNQQEGSICLCQQDPCTRKKCPNNFCGRFYHLIVDDHVENSPRWSCTDPTKWYNDFFQYAKCFLSTDSSANSLSDLDCTDLLTILIHNSYIRDSVHEVKSFQQCLEDRNKIFHSGSFEVTNSELDIYIDNMICVLEEKKCLIHNTDAQQAVKELHKLKNDLIRISDEDIDGLLNKIESEKTFIFRCQYLLIEIGTKVLRHIFDDKVRPNFGLYLASKKDKKNKLEGDKLQDLINAKKCKRITADQAEFLPPIDTNPSSSKFDITLLTCLLRNVCGMRPSGDPVWMNPNDNDYSTEADITRLRKCRNELSHSDTVIKSKTDFNAKWDELCRILNRLNQGLTLNKITDLQSSINDSQHLCIDEKKLDDFNAIIEAWKKMDGDVKGTHHMNDPLFKNWVRAAYGFKYLKDGLTGFVSNQLCHRHKDLKKMVAQQCTNVQPCTVCTSSNLLPDHGRIGCNQRNERNCFCRQAANTRRTCPNNFCGRFYHLIVDDHVENSPRWSSTDPTHWYNDFFHYAKCFLGTHSTAYSISDLDCTGLLSIVIHNLYIRTWIDNIDPFKQCRKDRNEIFHTGNFKLTDSELAGFIDNMISVLEDRTFLINDQSAQQAIKSLCELKTNDIHISDVDIKGLVQDAIRAITELSEEAQRDIENKRQQILNELSEFIRKVDKRRSEVIQEIDEHGVAAVSEIKRVKHEATSEISKQTEASIAEIRQTINASGEDIQQELKNKYMLNYTTITVSPLFRFENEELLNLYKIPTFFLTECHGAQSNQKDIEVTSCNQIFYKEDQECRNIYIIGDAGVGKTSFCQFLCLIWYKSKSCVDIVNEEMKEYVDFIEKFDFVFYITLRDSDRIDVIAMIVDQLFCTQSSDEWHKMYSCIKDILKQKECLVILDGLDEWKPDARGKKDISIPSRTFSEKCVFLTTCRPYKTENLQLRKDLDHQVKITGITGKSLIEYIKDVVGYINKKNDENKDPKRFVTEVIECGLADLLCVPIMTSHLVVVWFEQKLTNMSRTLIYGNIVDMLFEMAVNREIVFPPPTASELQLPDSLSKLNYMNKHVSLLEKLCLLSFRSLFNQDECVATLVFTRQQLESDPYCLYPEQMDLLYKIGILSKNKISRRFGKQEQKLNFLHLSYLEFFAALFVSSFDRNNIFNDIVVKNWTSLNQVLSFKNFFLFLAGFSIQTVDQLFRTIFPLISNDLTVIRRNTIFHYRPGGYNEQLKSLQSIVINCIKESRRSSDANVFIKLEDFYFEDNSNIEILKPLIELNKTCINSIYSENGKYVDIFDQIKNLQCLNVGQVLPADYKKFTQFILENKSTLHTVRIKGDSDTKPLIPELPVRSLQHLTSLSLSCVKMQHNSLHNLVKFLSDKVLIENIELWCVYCDNHQEDDRDCTLTLNLPHHTKLTSLHLWDVNISCNNVNNSSLKFITLAPRSERIVSCHIDVFNCIKVSQLEYLYISGRNWLDDNAVNTFIRTVNTLPCIKLLGLHYMKLPDDVLLQLHPHVTQVEINLHVVTMSRQYFHSFIENFVNNKTVIEVQLYECKITSVDGETHRELSESLDDMSEYLTSIPTVNILGKGRVKYKGEGRDGLALRFETTICQ